MTDYSTLSDADLKALYQKAKDPFESALSAEGVTGKVADIARSIYTQESGAGKNTTTSNAGAVGGMQIVPATFKSVADKDWNINDPTQNARAGIRYVKQLYDQAGGDPALTAAGYYGGPGGLEKARRGVAVADPRNPGAPNTLQYGQQVASRLNPVMAAGKAVTDAIIPSANAAEAPPQQASLYAKLSDEDLIAAYKKLQPQPAAPQQSTMGKIVNGALAIPGKVDDAIEASRGVVQDFGKGLLRGAAGIGNTIINAASVPVTPSGPNALINPDTQAPAVAANNADRNAGFKAYDASLPKNLPFNAGKLTAEIAGTSGIGGALAAPLKAAAPAIPVIGNAVGKLATAIGSGGMTVGGAPAATVGEGVGNLALRAAGGAINGGASAGLVDPSTAGTGAAIGAAVPVGAKILGKAGSAIGNAIAGGAVSPEVKALADRAQQLGIDIPADRLVNSKPLNALASSLNYVPLSGRAGTERTMQDQLNTALSRTFGQDSDNVTMALRKASGDLGDKFDQVLQNNTVKVDKQFMTDLADSANQASRELGSEGAGIIGKQVDDILSKAANGEIDGQAAYNIKKTLDRISQRNTPEAFYARDLKQKLMGALDRSLGPQEAADFATVRKQYGNMLSLENLAQNGAEGDISIARLANMKNINNPDLQELADISAQFLKGREGQHGAAQRVFGGLGAAGTAGAATMLGLPAVPVALGAGMAAGRGANALLNSSVVKNAVLGQPQSNQLLRFAGQPDLAQMFYKGAPVAASQ